MEDVPSDELGPHPRYGIQGDHRRRLCLTRADGRYVRKQFPSVFRESKQRAAIQPQLFHDARQGAFDFGADRVGCDADEARRDVRQHGLEL